MLYIVEIYYAHVNMFIIIYVNENKLELEQNLKKNTNPKSSSVHGFIIIMIILIIDIKGDVSPNNNVDWVSRKQFYKPNSKSLSRFG